MRLSVVALVIGIIVFSCSSFQKAIIEPKVELQNVEISEPTTSEATLIFNFQVDNPNAFAIKLDEVNYNIKLNDKPFTEGVVNEGLQVDGNSTAIIPLPIRVKYSDLFASVTHLVSLGATPYHLTGKAKMGGLSIPFEKKGEVKLTD